MPKGSTGGSLTYKGTGGNDKITVPDGTLESARIDGAGGSDTLDLSNYKTPGVGIWFSDWTRVYSHLDADRAFTGVAFDYELSWLQVTGTISRVENLIGSGGDDFLLVDITKPKLVNGGDGDDYVFTKGGSGTVVGGAGSDWIMAYATGNVMVGGTYDAAGAHADNTPDYFFGHPGARILDFEVGTDHLIFEAISPAKAATIQSATWIPYGTTGAQLVANGTVYAIFANVSPSDAATVELQMTLNSFVGSTPGIAELYGTASDDILFPGSGIADRIYLGPSSNDDYVTHFNTEADTLVFEDGTLVTWSNTTVNGTPALLGTFAGGSVTIGGLTTADLSALKVEGALSADTPGVDGLSTWSVPSDAFFYVG